MEMQVTKHLLVILQPVLTKAIGECTCSTHAVVGSLQRKLSQDVSNLRQVLGGLTCRNSVAVLVELRMEVSGM